MNYNPFVNPYAMQPAQQTNQINYASQSGFVSVQSEQEARIYPVALGNSITFMDECAPYMYIKTMGRSRFEQPTFEKIRLVREEPADASSTTESHENAKDIDLSVFASKDEMRALEELVETLKKEVEALKDRPRRKILKEVEVDDE